VIAVESNFDDDEVNAFISGLKWIILKQDITKGQIFSLLASALVKLHVMIYKKITNGKNVSFPIFPLSSLILVDDLTSDWGEIEFWHESFV
jgi:hypothetical protein